MSMYVTTLHDLRITSMSLILYCLNMDPIIVSFSVSVNSYKNVQQSMYKYVYVKMCILLNVCINMLLFKCTDSRNKCCKF